MELTTAILVAEHLRANAARYDRDGFTLRQVADEVSGILGRRYSTASVWRLREQLGLTWGKRHRTSREA